MNWAPVKLPTIPSRLHSGPAETATEAAEGAPIAAEPRNDTPTAGRCVEVTLPRSPADPRRGNACSRPLAGALVASEPPSQWPARGVTADVIL